MFKLISHYLLAFRIFFSSSLHVFFYLFLSESFRCGHWSSVLTLSRRCADASKVANSKIIVSNRKTFFKVYSLLLF